MNQENEIKNKSAVRRFKHCLNLLFLLLTIFSAVDSQAQTKTQKKQADKLFRNRGELYFRFMLKNKADIGEITRVISIDHVKGDTVFAFANKRGLLQFFGLGYSRFKILETPAEEFRRLENQEKRSKKKPRITSTQAFDAYPSYPAYEQAMAQFVATYPGLCKLINLGTLPSGRKILALKISDSVNINENEPRFLYTSSMHGDEAAGYPMMLKLADTLLKGYGNNPELTELVNQMEIWINPLANPDGTYKAGNNTVSGAVRFNANNIDLNRNYPDPQDGPHPDGEVYQPETKIFMKLADSLSFVMAANFHGGAEVWNFPWDTWQRRHPDENWWTAEGVKFSDSARSQSATYFNENYGYPNLPGVSQGFEWYEVNGGRQDYMNWFKNCREVTIEISDTKLIPNSQIPLHWKYLRRSLIAYMQASLRGIRGQVSDACTGLPVKARVWLQAHDRDSSHVYSSTILGNYHRPIFPGNYSMLISAPGYQSYSIPAIQVGNDNATLLNAILQPKEPIADFSDLKTDICASSVLFTDLTGSASQWSWDFGDGQTSNEKNPVHEYQQEGVFMVKLIAGNCAGSDTVFRMVNIISPEKPLTQGDTSNCGAVVHILKANSTNQTFWYASPQGGMALDTGNTFSTPLLDSTRNWYVKASRPLLLPNAGPVSNQLGTGGYFTGNTYHFLSFDVMHAFRLRSVRVFANTAGNRTIQLRNAQGQVVQSRIIQVPQGDSRLQLNFDIPKGEGWQLGIAGGASNNLYRNTVGAAYPYQVEGILSINGNSAGNPAIYYYFYDWEIASSCESAPAPVQALVLNAPRPRISISSTTADTVCDGNIIQLQAQFANTLNPQFTWFDGLAPLGSTLTTFTGFLSPGSHSITCRLLSEDTCAVGNPVVSLPKIIQVLPRPDAPVIALAGNIINSNSGPVLWYLNNQPIGATTASSIAVTSEGSYTAVISGNNGCISLPSEPIIINALAGKRDDTFVMWFDGNDVWLDNKIEKSQIVEMLNAEGKILQKILASPGKNKIELDNVPASLLLIRATGTGKLLKVIR
jgi:PKD repeat protein